MLTNILVLLLSLQIIFCVKDEHAIVETSLGAIKGTVLRSRLGDSFYAFRGIRYGKSPVRELRFQAPKPAEPWKGIFDATKDGPICPQPDMEYISEDCLRLNVYTKVLNESTTSDGLLPVIVYIHGGNFVSGSGNYEHDAGPDYFMDHEGIVFVTINYRLGALGFLSTGTPECPGNAGMKDQVLALEWVKEHIHHFGGAYSLVTLFGHGAGATSVGLHMATNKLLVKGIMMSGSSTPQWGYPKHQLDLSRRQAELVNCTQVEISDLLECLREVDFRKLVNGHRKLKELGTFPLILWTPVIEPDFGQRRFLERDPYARGFNSFSGKRVLIGITHEEMAGPALEVVRDKETLKRLNKDFDEVAPIIFQYERGTKRSKEISKILREGFFGQDPIDETSFDGINSLISDGLVGYGVNRFVRLVAKFAEVYYYEMTYVGRHSHVTLSNGESFGICHGDDLQYLMPIRNRFPTIKESDPERLMVKRMTKIWVTFAKTGKPIDAKDDSFKGMKWKSFDTSLENYVEIGRRLEERRSLNSWRYKIWDEAFKLNENSSQIVTKIFLSVLFLILISFRDRLF